MHFVENVGRKPLLLLAFAALPLRGGLWFDDPSWLLAVQVLDGVGGGLFDALLPLVLADIMAGTGHYSVAPGVVSTVQGIGGSSSQVVAGYIVTMAGYNAAPCNGGHGRTAAHNHRRARAGLGRRHDTKLSLRHDCSCGFRRRRIQFSIT